MDKVIKKEKEMEMEMEKEKEMRTEKVMRKKMEKVIRNKTMNIKVVKMKAKNKVNKFKNKIKN